MITGLAALLFVAVVSAKPLGDIFRGAAALILLAVILTSALYVLVPLLLVGGIALVAAGRSDHAKA